MTITNNVESKPKSPLKDKRSRPDLELFLIALIEREINTPYSLHASAGLSLGATIPALKKLEGARYLRRGPSGPRGRTEYRTTSKGTRYLSENWRSLLNGTPPPDMDSVFRIVCLAMMMGANLERVSAFVRKAAGRKATDATKRGETASPDRPNSACQEADFYARLQAEGAALRSSAESKYLFRLAHALLEGL